MPGPRRTVAAGLVLAALSAGPTVAATPAATPAATSAPTVDRTPADRRIGESSGLAVSPDHPGIVWTHNDSGNAPRLYAIDGRGETAATVRLADVADDDWEAMALFRGTDGRPAIAVGDIGDNGARRESVQIVLLPEPALRDATVRPARLLTLRYPDGAHDAEALLVDPSGRRMLVATKGMGSAIYEVPADVFPGTGAHRTDAGTLRRLVSTPVMFVTDGVLTASGHLLLRTYGELAVLPPITEDVVSGTVQPVAVIALPEQRQGESLALVDDHRVLVGSEGRSQPLWSVPLPADVTALLATRSPGSSAPQPSPAVTPTGSSTPTEVLTPATDAEPAGSRVAPGALAVTAALVAGAAATVTLVRRRRR